MKRARVRATWSKVLWSSLRTITRQLPPTPLPGPEVRGRSMVRPVILAEGSPSLWRRGLPGPLAMPALEALVELVGRGRLDVGGGGVEVLAGPPLDLVLEALDESGLVHGGHECGPGVEAPGDVPELGVDVLEDA